MRILINDSEHAAFDYTENFEKSMKLVDKIITPLVRDYLSNDNDADYKSFAESALHRQFPALIEATNGNFRGKRILDIGCGSRHSIYQRHDEETTYEPWLCRALLKMDAMPAGIDKNSNEGERFENYRMDLEEPKRDLLSFFPSGSFDIVHSMGLFTRDGAHIGNIERYLVQEVKRVLKPEGFFVHDEPYFVTGLSQLPYHPRQESYALSGRPLSPLNSP